MRIAVSGSRLVRWGGGIEFLRLCFEGLSSVSDEEGLSVHLLAPRPNQRHELSAAAVVGKLENGMRALLGIKREAPPRRVFSQHELLDGLRTSGGTPPACLFHRPGPRSFLRALRALRAEVVIPSMEVLPKDFPLPWVGYLADCQHRYLPELFSERDRADRDVYFERMLENASVVVVNSRAARDDFLRFYGKGRAEVVALPFAAQPRAEWLEPEEGETCAKYGLRGRFFLISNQFWVHKDHPTAFRAFAEALRAGLAPETELVCTGEMEDTRFPEYPTVVKRLISELDLTTRVRILGFIPKQDQVMLMKRAVAVIQPTLFEGGPGGGAAYDAISLGMPLIVSDIAVNRELPAPLVSFFPAKDSEALARAMVEIGRRERVAPSVESLRRQAQDNAKRFGRTLVEAARRAVRKRSEKLG